MATNNVTNTYITVSSGSVTMPVQPAFGAYANDQTDVTGDNTLYTVLWANEIFDQGSDFASDTFTAPVTGRYQFNSVVGIAGIGANHTVGQIRLVTSNRTYSEGYCSPYAVAGSSSYSFNISQLADLDASDTAYIQFFVAATNKTIDVTGAYSAFNGYLAC